MRKPNLKREELRLGMYVTAEQLSNIFDTYMILLYDHSEDKEGRLVYIGKTQNNDYDKWFLQGNPITPIYNVKEDSMVVYDELEA